jgi:hypothetical protein
MTVPFQACPTLLETGKSLGLIEDEEGDFRCGFCLYVLLADILRKSKDKVREKIIEEILNELVFFSDDLVDSLLFPEEEKPYCDPDHFDWSKYGRFVNDPFDLIQVGDEIRYDAGDHCLLAEVTSKDGKKLKFKGGSVDPSKVLNVSRHDKNWPRPIHEKFNRVVWLHKTQQNDK